MSQTKSKVKFVKVLFPPDFTTFSLLIKSLIVRIKSSGAACPNQTLNVSRCDYAFTSCVKRVREKKTQLFSLNNFI